MITDAIMGFVHGLVSWVIGLLPYHHWADFYPHGTTDGTSAASWVQMVITVNYFLPLWEFVSLVGIYVGVLLAWAAIRFVLRLIPTIG